jgi:hypothetical protein
MFGIKITSWCSKSGFGGLSILRRLKNSNGYSPCVFMLVPQTPSVGHVNPFFYQWWGCEKTSTARNRVSSTIGGMPHPRYALFAWNHPTAACGVRGLLLGGGGANICMKSDIKAIVVTSKEFKVPPAATPTTLTFTKPLLVSS